MPKVVEFNGITRLDLPAERILSKALEADLSTAVVLGYEQDGTFYFASTKADGGDVLWLLEKARYELLRAGGAIEE